MLILPFLFFAFGIDCLTSSSSEFRLTITVPGHPTIQASLSDDATTSSSSYSSTSSLSSLSLPSSVSSLLLSSPSSTELDVATSSSKTNTNTTTNNNSTTNSLFSEISESTTAAQTSVNFTETEPDIIMPIEIPVVSEELLNQTLLDNITIEIKSDDDSFTNDSFIDMDYNNFTESINHETRDSALLTQEENSYFLTFEEWKRKKISDDEFNEHENKRKQSQQKTIKQGNSINDGPLGEEMEIEISMFGGSHNVNSNEDEEEAKGKIYKDRFNYASFDCAATIVKTNSEAKGASSILNANKDSYLLNECKSDSMFVIIELCEDILVDEVSIGNYEFFSSMFKKIRVSVSDRYPILNNNGWKTLGEFNAENIRNLQLFKIENPLIWAKFLKLEVLSYYGDEFYCPISSVQVHGKTMIEQFKEEEKEEHIKTQEEIADKSTELLLSDDNKPTSTVIDDVIPSFNLSISPSEDKYMNFTIINQTSSGENEECIITPYLGLNEFLKELQKIEDEKRESCKEEDIISTSVDIKPKAASQTATTQESIYKNIVKRLSLLESNATLSLLYIEEQSKILSNAFENLEVRQNLRFNNLINQLNVTILSQIHNFKSLNTELSLNFESLFNYQNKKFKELLAEDHNKFSKFESSLSFQKNFNYLNLTIITLLSVYIIVTRDTYIESEFIQPFQQQQYIQQQLFNESYNEVIDTSNGEIQYSPPSSPTISIRKRSKLMDKFSLLISPSTRRSVSPPSSLAPSQTSAIDTSDHGQLYTIPQSPPKSPSDLEPQMEYTYDDDEEDDDDSVNHTPDEKILDSVDEKFLEDVDGDEVMIKGINLDIEINEYRSTSGAGSNGSSVDLPSNNGKADNGLSATSWEKIKRKKNKKGKKNAK